MVNVSHYLITDFLFQSIPLYSNGSMTPDNSFGVLVVSIVFYLRDSKSNIPTFVYKFDTIQKIGNSYNSYNSNFQKILK